MEIIVIASATALVSIGYLLRRVVHARVRASIPIRIHVGGTRGKSTTTRLIAAGLRSSGIRAIAKTTGTEPRLIDTDGREHVWRRFGPASIAEQIRFMHRARRAGARAIVLECMAVRPVLVRASERLIVGATMAVITNARADHLEEGEAEAPLLELVPRNGIVVAAREAVTRTLEAAVALRESRLEVVDAIGRAANEALARRVCELAGAVAPRFDSVHADPGGFFMHDLELAGKRLRFANAFACNDSESLALMQAEHPGGPRVIVLNHRNDRPLRSLQFLDYVAGLSDRPPVLLLSDTAWLRRAARRRGIAFARLRNDARLLRAIASHAPDGAVIWGIANYHGAGAALLRAVQAA